MVGKTHIAGGLFLASTLTTATGIYQPLGCDTSLVLFGIYLFGSSLGSILPDIDKRNSTISGKNVGTKATSLITRLIFTHRGFTHSILCLLILSTLSSPLAFAGVYTKALWMGIILGYGSHLILDMLNPTGIALLYPLDNMISFAKIKTSGLIEKLLFLGFVIGFINITLPQVKPFIPNFSMILSKIF